MFKAIGMFFEMIQSILQGTHNLVGIYEQSTEIAVKKMDQLVAEQAVEAQRLIDANK